MNFIYVFLGGGLGSTCRYTISLVMGKNEVGAFPWPTLLSNTIACLLAGMLISWLPKTFIHEQGRLWLLTGFCGGLSTFSAFSAENVSMIQSGHWLMAAIYTVVSILTGFAAVFLGMKLFL